MRAFVQSCAEARVASIYASIELEDLGSCRTLVDSIAVSLFGNMTVETREIHIITKE